MLVTAAFLTAACGTTPPASAPAPASGSGASPIAAVPGIEAEAVRLRTDEVVGGQVQVRVTNTGDDGFTVTAVTLDSPGFALLPSTAVTAEFPPGRVIDLPTPYGSPECDAAPLPAEARLSVVRPDGRVDDVRVPLAGDVLALVHDEECAEQAVAEVVDVSVTGLSDDGEAVSGALTLTRRSGDQRVSATALSRSVLLEARADRLPLILDADEPRVTTAVSFTPATCDPHVLSETKKPYVFPLTVEVGGADPVPVDLPLDDAARDRLAALVQRVCGAAD
ncbi:hypothetical protein SAMN06272737_10422 [Blastococcus mobilis]|uniref:Uncharacterized protein n=1 Tax=Blastococcus mobilis TaxID=1938746 RepID=A0A238VNS5_9ACTN|nr:hypothetical protein SAMN06272737_10422 [Blastococcus mobilis]